jgi:hypothetical protein
MQEMRAVFQGLSDRGAQVGKRPGGLYRSGKMHEVQIMHQGMQVLVY